MKLVYTHPNIAVVTQAQALVEHAGIECALRNEYASGATGELAPISVWPELWVVSEEDADHAEAIVNKFQQAIHDSDWECAQCGGSNPATFESCWQCGNNGP